MERPAESVEIAKWNSKMMIPMTCSLPNLNGIGMVGWNEL
jgi:hypothetical protein